MSKNVNSTAYRKIDVDALDDEKFEEVGEDNEGATFIDEKSVSNMLAAGQSLEALRSVLVNVHLSKIDQRTKDSAVETVARVLQSFRTPQIESALSSLSIEQADILTKFVYRAFEIVGEGAVCQCLLLWHAQIVAKFGKGPIVRTLASRNRL